MPNLQPNQNNGVIDNPRPTDWVMGAETGITYEVVNPSGNWFQDLPTDEKQSDPKGDTLACTNFSWSNAVETQIDFKIRNGQIDFDTVKKLEDLGFFDANYHFKSPLLFDGFFTFCKFVVYDM